MSQIVKLHLQVNIAYCSLSIYPMDALKDALYMTSPTCLIIFYVFIIYFSVLYYKDALCIATLHEKCFTNKWLIGFNTIDGTFLGFVIQS